MEDTQAVGMMYTAADGGPGGLRAALGSLMFQQAAPCPLSPIVPGSPTRLLLPTCTTAALPSLSLRYGRDLQRLHSQLRVEAPGLDNAGVYNKSGDRKNQECDFRY